MKTQEKNGGMEQIAGGIHWPTHTGIPRVPVRLQSLVSIAINQKLTTMENQIQQQWSFHPEKFAESSWRGCSKLVNPETMLNIPIPNMDQRGWDLLRPFTWARDSSK